MSLEPKLEQLITGTTKLLGVIGDPIEHSFSPVMHNAAIAQMGLDYAYLPFPIAPENLATAIAGFAAIGLVGFNVTIPHKQAIMPLLSEISPAAKAIGAVNTVWHTETGWTGTNTDVDGFLAPLQGESRDWQQRTALILGNGGAARAVVAGCARLGVDRVCVVGRNPQKLAQFAQSWHASPLSVNLETASWEQLPDLLDRATLLVNATPIGMAPETDRSPIEAELMAKLAPEAIAYDLIYNPRPTQFLKLAQGVGARAIDGLEMLVQQGAAALRIWTDRSVPADVMREALQRHLAARK